MLVTFLMGVVKVCVDEYKTKTSAKRADTSLFFSLPGILLLLLIEIVLLAVGIPYQLVLVGLLAYLICAILKK